MKKEDKKTPTGIRSALIHKITWASPGGVTRNQIDHITITRCFKRLADVTANRSADIASDHELVVAKVELKLRTLGTRRGKQQGYEIGD